VSQAKRILLVEDDEDFRNGLATLLESEGYRVTTTSDGHHALELAANTRFDVLIADIRLPGLSGDQVMQQLKRLEPEAEAILITAHLDLQSASEALRDGAFDYISKPFESEQLLTILGKAIEHQAHRRMAAAQVDQAKWSQQDQNRIIGRSQLMLELFKLIGRIAPTDSTVLIWGDSGTGKELVAREIHRLNRRAVKPFVAINCGALTETLLETELFGHERGAFTGAHERKRGLFEEADGGTILLDEITETSPAFQVKLLRVLQEGEIKPVGSTKSLKVNVRVLAASNADPQELMKQQRFREDLLHRISTITIKVPALRDRLEDIPLLVEYFLAKHRLADHQPVTIAASAIDLLKRYPWPGNVRELEHVIKQAMILNLTGIIAADDLPLKLVRSSLTDDQPPRALQEANRQHLIRILRETQGNKTQAAKILGISRKTLRDMMARLQIDDDFPN
jgi:two-component system, NtrC family, response regulator HydG